MTTEELENRLREAKLRPTRQRIALAQLLFDKDKSHVTAEELHKKAISAKLDISLATVYNTLNQFTDAGLLREVACEGNTSYYDTNINDHHHFYIKNNGDNELVDIPAGNIQVKGLESIPPGKKIDRIDVIVQLVDI